MIFINVKNNKLALASSKIGDTQYSKKFQDLRVTRKIGDRIIINTCSIFDSVNDLINPAITNPLLASSSDDTEAFLNVYN